MKKAQLFSQPIIIIFALVIAALILTWGSYNIYKLTKTARTIELGTALTDLKDLVNTYYNLDTGSSTEINIKLPKQVKYICFTNPNEPLVITNNIEKISPDLAQLLQIKSKNIFIIPTTIKPSTYYIKNLKPIENPLCIKTLNSLKAIIENKGSYVEIRPIYEVY